MSGQAYRGETTDHVLSVKEVPVVACVLQREIVYHVICVKLREVLYHMKGFKHRNK